MQEGRELTPEQQAIIDAAVKGENVFVSGPAGVGKSYTLRRLIEEMKRIHGPEKVFSTASTGIAGTHIGGGTIHSFSGGGKLDASITALVTAAMKNGGGERWKECKVLVIDEISMLEGGVFDKLESMGNRLRPHVHNRPFGGIQLIVTGDFFQLPPVVRYDNKTWKFAFESNAWKKCNFKNFILTKIFRQEHEDFVRMLQKIRVGLCGPEEEAMLRSRVRAKLADRAVHLYCTNKNVDAENDRELDKIQGEPLHVYKAKDKGKDKAKLDKSMLVPKELRLKKGAQVILLKNLNPPHLVNGSQGVVVGFEAGELNGNIGKKLYPRVRFQNGKEELLRNQSFKMESGGITVAERQQVPLKLSWAMTIHKSQGMTLNSVVMNIADAFGPGQAYVALSRCTSLEGMSLENFNPHRIRAEPRVLQFYADLGDPLAQESLSKTKTNNVMEPWRKKQKTQDDSTKSFFKPTSKPISRIIEEDDY